MFLIALVFFLVVLPLLLTVDFTHLAILSTYIGLAHLVLLLVVLAIMWYGMRYDAINRIWQRRHRGGLLQKSTKNKQPHRFEEPT